MLIGACPAIPADLPNPGVTRDRDRLHRWCSTAVTAFTAALAVLAAAIVAVAMGIT
jgi:hypothetical protein